MNKDAITAETNRATAEETRIDNKLDAEITRSTTKDIQIETKLNAEITRATSEETRIDDKLDAEITRSTAKDIQLEIDINVETVRAIAAETRIDDKLDAEITRSTAKDTNQDTRLTAIEAKNVAQDTAISNEVTRATAEENSIKEKNTNQDIRLAQLESVVDPEGHQDFQNEFTVTLGSLGSGRVGYRSSSNTGSISHNTFYYGNNLHTLQEFSISSGGVIRIVTDSFLTEADGTTELRVLKIYIDGEKRYEGNVNFSNQSILFTTSDLIIANLTNDNLRSIFRNVFFDIQDAESAFTEEQLVALSQNSATLTLPTRVATAKIKLGSVYDVSEDFANRLAPSGGTSGQVLRKKSGTDYDLEWGTVSGGDGSNYYSALPSNINNATGTQGQTLYYRGKNSDGDSVWLRVKNDVSGTVGSFTGGVEQTRITFKQDGLEVEARTRGVTAGNGSFTAWGSWVEQTTEVDTTALETRITANTTKNTAQDIAINANKAQAEANREEISILNSPKRSQFFDSVTVDATVDSSDDFFWSGARGVNASINEPFDFTAFSNDVANYSSSISNASISLSAVCNCKISGRNICITSCVCYAISLKQHQRCSVISLRYRCVFCNSI